MLPSQIRIPHSLNSHHILKFIFLENRQGRRFIRITSGFVVKGLLGAMAHHAEQFHHRNIIGTGIGTLAAAHAGGADMGQARQVIENRVRGHFERTFVARPLQVLERVMVKHIRYKDAFLTVPQITVSFL